MGPEPLTSEFPDGIGETHIGPRSALHAYRPWLSLAVLTLLLGVAFTGALGGVKNTIINAGNSNAAISFSAPAILRNGQLFEMRMAITARMPIAKPVITVPVAYWHDLTINSFHPGPTKEESRGGFYLMEFEPLAAGERMDIKIDGQVNPSLIGSASGRIELRDGQIPLVSLPVSVRVLP